MISGIGEKTIEAMKQQTIDLIDTHKVNIQKVFNRTKDGKVKVGLAINIFRKDEGLKVETDITYVVEKVSDKQEAFIKENQAPLFPKMTNEG